VRPLIAGGTRVLISHDVEHGLAEADLVLGLRGGRTAFVAEAPSAAEVRELYG
jgi:heme exporter protein A